MSMKTAIVLCSGGLDSVVTAYYVKMLQKKHLESTKTKRFLCHQNSADFEDTKVPNRAQGLFDAKKKLSYNDLIILFFDYGQRTLKQERRASQFCAKKLKAKFIEIKLSLLREICGDLLTKKRAKKIKRNELKNSKKESLKWYVPHRNLIFLSYAMSLAESIFIRNGKKCSIFVGFKNEGKESYPDTTEAFVKEMNIIQKVSSSCKFEIIAPLIKKDKEDIVALGKKLGVDLSKTFSCYASAGKMHCGTCLACKLRQEGFYWANVGDPTEYAN